MGNEAESIDAGSGAIAIRSDDGGSVRASDVDRGTIHKLNAQAEAARTLLLNIRDVIGDDEEAAADAIEGETDLHEAIAGAVLRISDLEAHEDAIASIIKTLGERKSRFASQADRIRTAICVAMGVAGIKKLELAQATISRRAVPPSAVFTNEADVPSRFWKPQDPKLDRKAVLDALKAKEVVPGATLSNGSETISIKAN